MNSRPDARSHPVGLAFAAILGLNLALLVVASPECHGADNITTASDASRASTMDDVSRARSMDNAHRADALKILEDRLSAQPADSDARTLYGMMLSWEGRYDDAREQLKMVLAAHPGHRDALTALVNVELWSDHPADAERLARRGLEDDSNDADLLVARAKALKAMKRLREARASTTAALRVDPTNQVAKNLHDDVSDTLRRFEASLTHTSDWFSDGRPVWREDQVQLSDKTNLGSVTARFSNANRFNEMSQQAEIDFYPHIRPGTYAYLNAGYSPDARLYPRYRAAGDIVQSLGRGYEITAGYRRLAFGAGINIYTASLTKYYGPWMFTGRTYLTPDSIGTSRSYQLSVRRYMGDGRNYWTVRGGWGSSPTEIQSLTDIGILSSSTIFGELSHIVSRRMTFAVQAGVSRQDRVGITGLYDVTASANLYYRF